MDVQSVVVGNAGASAPHENMQPYSVTNFIICVAGIYPPRS
jgi:microcystin-dependent protein